MTGLAAGSLGLVADAAHSGTDLVAALLTFFADRRRDEARRRGSHLYGHGKAEHLAALAEAGFLVIVSIGVAALAVARLAGWVELETSSPRGGSSPCCSWSSRSTSRASLVSYRTGPAVLERGARSRTRVHFGSDLARDARRDRRPRRGPGGLPEGDSIAALFVAVLVVTAAGRLIRRNVDVLMDRAPADAVRGGARRDRRASTRRSPFAGSASARPAAAPSPTS